ncbi:MAG: UTRA domain-containing protein [Clostridia bacterium]
MLSSIYSFSEELRKQNITPSTRVLSLNRISARPPLTTKLQVEAGRLVDVVLRLRLADDTPYAYETSYIPSEYLDGATAAEIAQQGLYNTIEQKSGFRPDKAVETFEASIAPEVICEALGRKGVLGIMQLERTAYYKDVVVEYCTSAIAGDKYRFRVTLE